MPAWKKSAARVLSSPRALERGVVFAILLCAFLVRLWLLPPPYAPDLGDEVSYLSGGCVLLEGITPTFKFAPAAFVTWLTFVYVGIDSVARFIAPSAPIADQPLTLRPLTAVDSALFDVYADMSGLRTAVSLAILGLSLVGVWAAARLGKNHAGLPGMILGGGLMALAPTVATLAVQTRPYAPAWTFALLSLSFAAKASPRRPWLSPGLFLGLAAASRIDMILAAPLVFWEVSRRQSQSLSFRDRGTTLARLSGTAAATFLIAAPWYLTHFFGNLRVIASVRFLNLAGVPDLNQLKAVFWTEGLGPAMLLIFAGLLLKFRGDRIHISLLALYLSLLMASAYMGTQFGLRHQGALLVAVVALAPLALGAIQECSFLGRRDQVAVGLLVGVLLFPLFRTVELCAGWGESWVDDGAVEWIESNVPPGTTVYVQSHFETPLPTTGAGERIWMEVNDENAWRKKFDAAARRWDLPDDLVPRAFSEEHLYQERGNRRRFFILAGPYQPLRPRFELRLVSGSPFDLGNEAAWETFDREGGVLLWRGERPKGLGEPDRSWISPGGDGVFVYVKQRRL